MFVVAPWYWLATRLASVSPGSSSESFSGMKLPITCVTAIASPSARPRPRMIAATTPPRHVGHDDGLHHLPARRAETERRLLELLRHAEEELAADRRGDRDRHDREHDDRREDGRLDLVLPVGEDRDPAERLAEESAARAARRTGRGRRCPRARRRPTARRRACRSVSRSARGSTAVRARSGRGRSRSRAAPR